MDFLQAQPVLALDAQRLANVRRLIVVGDLHGDSWSLGRILRHFDSNNDLLLFLGDYADRGSYGIEVVERVHQLLRRYPRRVIALQGDHEVYSAKGEANFFPCHLSSEAVERWGSWPFFMDAVYRHFIGQLCLGMLIPGEALFIHGGLSPRIKRLNSLMRPAPELIEDLLYSDATDEHRDQRPNLLRGRGLRFGVDTTRSVCENLGIKRIFRAHQHELARERPAVMHDRRLITIVTSRSYVREPYALILDPRDTAAGSILRLKQDSVEPFNLDSLSQLAFHDQIRLLAKAQQSEDMIQAIRNLSRRLRSRSLPQNARLEDWTGLPDPAAGTAYYRFTLDQLLRDASPKSTSKEIFVVLCELQSKKIKQLYFNRHGLQPGRFHRVEVKLRDSATP